jgi:hypothetical protein
MLCSPVTFISFIWIGNAKNRVLRTRFGSRKDVSCCTELRNGELDNRCCWVNMSRTREVKVHHVDACVHSAVGNTVF